MDRIRSTIALGMFDGVHLGHRALLDCTRKIAAETGSLGTVFTFSSHPMEYFNKGVYYLSTNENRRRLFLSMGMDRVDMVPFDGSVADLSPQEFIGLLLKKHDIDTLVVGFNYSFGKGGLGDSAALVKLGEGMGFSVKVVPPVMYEGEAVSSSRIRSCIRLGSVEEAANMLGRNYSIGGTVVSNRHIGRRLGFPTANIEADGMVMPKDGVYASWAIIEGTAYPAVTNVGMNPTVEGTKRTIETHLIDTELELYGKAMEVEFVGFIRDEQRFTCIQELSQRIGIDVKTAKKLLETQK